MVHQADNVSRLINETAAGEKAVAVAVSGGPDSMALCWLVAQQAPAAMAVHALTVDHGLRPESCKEAKQVGAWIKGWPSVSHSILTLNGLGSSRVMETAREARYQALADYCRRKKIRVLLLAHHLDDQAETFLFRLAKGSGLDGLAAMQPVRAYDQRLMLVRPLLDLPKKSLVALCEKNGIPFVADPTNADDRYARSRLRQAHGVLAAEGLTAQRLATTAHRMARAKEALVHFTDMAFSRALKQSDRKKIILDRAYLAVQPAEIRLRVLATALQRLSLNDKPYGPRMDRLEALAEDLFSPQPFRKRTLGGALFSLRAKTQEIHIEEE